MSHSIALDPDTRADHEPFGDKSMGLHDVRADIAYQRLAMVNVVFLGEPGGNPWFMMDAGLPGMAGFIRRAAEARYGKGARPAAILLTHGHIDHVGSLEALADEWDVPIYAHELEMPYLNGGASYPPPDPKVGGGIMSPLSKFFSRGPINVSRWLQPYATDHTTPLGDWHWLHVPGHTPGQVAFFRDSDRSIIAGDAFITTAQESAYSVTVQKLEMHGPPMYYTQDWDAARDSVQRLAALEPELAVCGHGRPIHGPQLRQALHHLAHNFDQIALPWHGKYLNHPARPEDGTAYTQKQS
ncbi:MAG TPA: MBL fold metallo-hydrolase [Phycisphaerae bacterium]|nr:MBL fold metallo-hydrolase [Phycisphaerae bacterium]